MHELQDILDLLKRCDEEGTSLPKFVADTYNSMPPSSGFEIVAHSMQSLIHEISNLKSEIESLRENRFTEEFHHQSNTLIQEDLLVIKGEIRKLNLRLMGDEVRRSSLTINSLDKACHSHVKNKPLRETENYLRISSEFDSNLTLLSPSAPPASQENWHMME